MHDLNISSTELASHELAHGTITESHFYEDHTNDISSGDQCFCE